MSCRRALEIDLLGFLADPRAPEHAAFRDHYPRCPQCAAEVRAWSELCHELAAAVPATEHPAPEQLARYASRADAPSQADRARLETHLAACAPCRDELAGLRRFDPVRLAAALSTRPGERSGGASWLDGLRRLLWHPAFAYTLAGLLLVPFLYRTLRPTLEATPGRVVTLAKRAPQPDAVAPLEDRAVSRERAAPPAEEAPKVRSGAAKASAPQRPETLAAGRADALAEAAPAAPLAAELRLQSEGTTRVDAARARQGLRLQLPVSETGPLAVRVVQVEGDRELRQRSFAAPSVAALALALPPGWLEPGSYRVELRTEGADSPARVFPLEVTP